jgi:hypothetical protein
LEDIPMLLKRFKIRVLTKDVVSCAMSIVHARIIGAMDPSFTAS